MNKLIKKIAFCAFILAFANLQVKANDKKSFDPGEMIMHHISDEHEINIIADIGIPLPIIVFTQDGLNCFCSSNLYNNPQSQTYTKEEQQEEASYYAYKDFILYHEHIYLKQENGPPLSFDDKGEITNKSVTIDLSITKNVIGIFIVCIIMLIMFLSVAKSYKKREGKEPKGLQSLIEPLIFFVKDDIAEPAIGEETDRFMPFLLSLFFFIWIGNILGMFPFIGGINVTGSLSVVAVLAIIVFIITTVNGKKHYWKEVFAPPNVPLPLKYLILVPIEFVNIFTKPFILVVRLVANMTAGHITMLALVSIVFLFGETVLSGVSLGIGTSLFTVFMNLIEFLIGFLQAYVFTILAALYFGMAVEKAH